MYNSKILKFLLFVLVTAFVGGFAAGLDDGSVKISVGQNMVVSGNDIKAGQYLVQWGPEGTGSTVTFKLQGDVICKVPGKISKLEKKSQYDALQSLKDANGRQLLKAIELGPKQIRIAFD
jgi:hypothetical protein